MERESSSPGSMSRTLSASHFITHVNNVPTRPLEEALTEVLKVSDNKCKDLGTCHGLKGGRARILT